MLIESIIKRPKGTKITLGANTYNFKADDEGRHVADVEDHGHIATLLAIREGFRPADGTLAALSSAELPTFDGYFFIVRGPQDAQAMAHWLSGIPEMQMVEDFEQVLLIDKIAIGEASLGGYALPPAIPDIFPSTLSDTAAAMAADAPSTAGPSPQPSADNSILPTVQTQPASPDSNTGASTAAGDGGAGVAGDAGTDSDQLEDLDREALAMRYSTIVGHRPNGKWSAEKIAAVLAEQEQ